MGKTIAEVLIEEGMAKGALASQRKTLLLLLRKKFKHVPPAMEAEINATEGAKILDDWIDAVVVAKKLADIPFAPRA